MSAVLAMDAEKIEEVIAPIEGVQIANYNARDRLLSLVRQRRLPRQERN